MSTHWVDEVGDDWGQVRTELTRLFVVAREAARAGDSLVLVVHADDLLGRRGSGNAMVANGALAAARTAALEGIRGGWTVNVIGWDGVIGREEVEDLAEQLSSSGRLTGELIRFGPGHLGKALP